MSCRPRPADWLAVLALLLLDLAAYGRLLDPRFMLADYDAFVYFYPLRAYAAAAVQAGRLPLWNPDTFLGVPFIANPQTAFFYPFSWLFLWLPVPWAYGLNLVAHVLLAGLAFYAFARVSLATCAPAALVGAMAFMLGGALSGQYGHLNQISAAAWLPLVLLLADQSVARRSWRLALAAAAAVGLQLFAGHPQQSYMTLGATALVCLWRAWPDGGWGLARAAGRAVLIGALGAALAAVQLIPTAELAAASIRGGGVSYRDAVADSLWPWLVARALLPSFANDLGSTEFLGYVGIVPLLLAGLALGTVAGRQLALCLPLVIGSLFLALGGGNPAYPWLYAVVPGLASFRVPARWLLLYTVGIAWLAALGLDWLLQRRGPHLTGRQWARLLGTAALLVAAGLTVYLLGVRATRGLQLTWLGLGVLGLLLIAGCSWPSGRAWTRPALVLVVGAELWAAGGDLAPRLPIPIEAYSQPRDSTLFIQSRLGDDRFLSIAAEDYELKETPDYREWFADLPEPALVGFLVAAKRNEILTPNLNLLYGLADVDGYDGGLLPLHRFLSLGGLLVPPGRLRTDGVLISRLDSLPPRPLMDLLNIRMVLAGRAKDVEADGVEYDRGLLASLRPGERLDLARVPQRGYTSLGLISALRGDSPANGTPVALLEIAAEDGSVEQVPILAGRDTGASRPPTSGGLSPTLEVVRPWSSTAEGDPIEYLAQVAIPTVTLQRLSLTNVGTGPLDLRALTLIDERDGAFTPLVLDDGFERTGFFDMKVYEYPGVLARTYLVHRAVEVDDEAGLELMGSPDFRPGSLAVVEPSAKLDLAGSVDRSDFVIVVERAPERLVVRASTASPALLVRSEAFYPGWKVTVDGRSAPLIRTDLALQGVALLPGEHQVVFSYAPGSLRLGALISLIAGMFMAGLVLAPNPRRFGRDRRGRLRPGEAG